MLQNTGTYYQVENGVIVDPPQEVYVQSREITASPFSRPTYVNGVTVGASADDAELAALGLYAYWYDDGGIPPSDLYERQEGAPTVVGEQVHRVDTWVPRQYDEQRKILEGEIANQVPSYGASEMQIDPGKAHDLDRHVSAASDKKRELDNTADADLLTFDSSLQLDDPQALDVGYTNFSVSIAYLDPWAGAPSDNVGFVCAIELRAGDEALGSEARLYVVDAPADVGAVLPFVQDAGDPKLWRCESRDGFKWQDPAAACTVRLLWGAGSLPVSPDLTAQGLHDRQSVIVRYGKAS